MAGELAILGGPKAITVDTSEQWLRPVEEMKAAVCELIDEGVLTGAGKAVRKQFEEEFKEYIGCKYVLTTSHGHTALASGFFAAGLGAGDEFIHPTLGYIGSYAGALHMGAKIVFCEPDPLTLLTDPADVEKRITAKTRVISPVHFCGRVCDMDSLLDICQRHNVIMVEDAAHAHGSEWGGRKIGSFGHIACFSMQGIDPRSKPVACGEGGILATNDRELYERALIYCHLHRSGARDELTNPVYQKLEAQFLGWKWRAHPLPLALARISLRHLPYRIERFAATRDELVDKIKETPGFEIAHNYPKAKASEIYGGLRFLYNPDALDGLPAARFCEALRAEGLDVSFPAWRAPEHLRSLYTQDLPGLWGEGHPGPANMPLPRYAEGDFPVAEGLNDRVIGISGWIEPAEGLIDQTATAIRKVVDQHKKLL